MTTGLLLFIILAATLFVAGQIYLYTRRRKAGRFFERLARALGVSRRHTRIDLRIAAHRVVVDAQVTNDDRPEELRLALGSGLPGSLRLTRGAAGRHYDDCRHHHPTPLGRPFAGWHVWSEYPDLLARLAADRNVVGLLTDLANLGFTRIELAGKKLRAFWPDFPWAAEDHRWDAPDQESLPGRVRSAAETLSNLATAAGIALRSGRPLSLPRVWARFVALLLSPVVVLIAGIAGLILVYGDYPTLRDSQLLALMTLAGTALAALYTLLSWFVLRGSARRGGRTALIGFVALFGFCMGSSVPAVWWNGSGPQGPGRRVTVEVVKLKRESSLDSIRGRILEKILGDESAIKDWATTYRAIVRSWRDDSLYGIELSQAQFESIGGEGDRIEFTVHPGALGLEWYSDVEVDDP